MPPAFSRSEKHLRDAWHRHRVGEFEGSLVACYKAFECLGFNLFKNDEIKRREVVDLLMDGVEGEKNEVVLQLLKTLQDFCHLARHERGDPISIRHEDSQLALICASAALSYLAPLYKAE